MSEDDAVDADVDAPKDDEGSEPNGATESNEGIESSTEGNAKSAGDASGSGAAAVERVQGDDDNDRESLADRVADHDEALAEDVAELQDRVDRLEATVRERDELIEQKDEQIEQQDDAIEEKADEVEDLTSRLKRKQADFQNYKQRQRKKMDRMRERAAEEVLSGVVGVRDNLIRALQQDAEADIRPGVESTLEEFDRVLADEGVDPIEPEPGEDVDPTRHQVMMRVDSDQPAGTVDELFQPGYELGDRVIREAQVTVSENEE